jgi:hypothetical protein
VRVAELVVAGIVGALGIRSLVYWARRPFVGTGVRGHALFALHVTARVVSWFALATLFVLYATVATTDPVSGERVAAEGRAFIDAAKEYAWFYVVFLALAAVQFVTAYFLGAGRED